MLTPTLGTINVGHHHARKIDVLPGPQIYAFAGDLGQAHRFKTLAEVHHARPSQSGHPLDYPIALSQGLMAQFISTGITTNAIGVNTLLAFLYGGVVSAAPSKARCNRGFSIRTTTIPLSAQGKLSADPFLRFLTDTFCQGPPTVREAIFLTTWTIQHVIDTNPGGVAPPIRIAVLEKPDNQWAARELPEDEIAEHQQAIESAGEALRRWRDQLQSGEAAEGAPEPPPAPAGGAAS